MLKIGDFAKFTRISIHQLRHYDRIQLLSPAKVDSHSGYRYYSEEQIPTANRIQLLKSMGFSLPRIKEILARYQSEASLLTFFDSQLREKQAEMALLENQIQLLQQAKRDLQKDKNPLKYSLVVKKLPQRLVASHRGTIPTHQMEGLLWGKMNKLAAAMQLKYADPSFDVAIFHRHGAEGASVDVEIQRSVLKEFPSTDQLVCKKIPETLAISAAYQGDYNQIQLIIKEIVHWTTKNDYELQGKIMSVYHISPKSTQNEENFLTEICFPIKKRS